MHSWFSSVEKVGFNSYLHHIGEIQLTHRCAWTSFHLWRSCKEKLRAWCLLCIGDLCGHGLFSMGHWTEAVSREPADWCYNINTTRLECRFHLLGVVQLLGEVWHIARTVQQLLVMVSWWLLTTLIFLYMCVTVQSMLMIDRLRICCFLTCPVPFMVITLLEWGDKACAYTHTDCHKIDT